jgi:hypothetical protein
MNENILFETKHIRLLKNENSEYCLIIQDTEVNDFIEEYLYDNYQIQALRVEINNDIISSYYNYFESNYQIEKLINALVNLEVSIIQKIFKLNN